MVLPKQTVCGRHLTETLCRKFARSSPVAGTPCQKSSSGHEHECHGILGLLMSLMMNLEFFS